MSCENRDARSTEDIAKENAMLRAQNSMLLGKFHSHVSLLERELSIRRNYEEALIRQKKFLRKVIDLNPNFIFAKNRKSEFTLVNKALAEAYGSNPKELLGKSDADFSANEEEVEHFRKDDLHVMDSLQELIIPTETLTDAEGNQRFLRTIKRAIVDEDGRGTHLLGVATDITELTLNQKKLEHLGAIVKSSEAAIASVCSKGLFTSWNMSASKLFGYTEEEALGKHTSIICPPELLGQDESFFKKLLQGEAIEGVETRRLRKNGTIVHVHLTISALRDSNGRVIGSSAIARDISKRVAIERELKLHRENLSQLVEEKTSELKALQKKLRTSERLAAMGSLAAGIAHEINTPVGSIMLTAENCTQKVKALSDVEQIKEQLTISNNKILNNAKKCSSIISDALSFARHKQSPRSHLDINTLLHSLHDSLEEQAKRAGATIRCDLENNLPAVKANPLEIEQVILNLIQNSLQSSEKCSVIKINTWSTDLGQTCLSIEDNGCGIGVAEKSKVFEPFYSSRLKAGGTGLGLSIVKQILTAHGGSIDLESKLGCGTKFTILFPKNEMLNLSSKMPLAI